MGYVEQWRQLQKSALGRRRIANDPKRLGLRIDLPLHPTIKVCLGLLALMVSGPFLLPFHTDPIPGFWSEWWAAVFGLAAAVIGLFTARGRLPLASLLFIPAVLLAVLLTQFVLGRLAFPHIALLYAVYLLWAGLLMVLGRYLANAIGLVRLVEVLAGAIALAALVGAAIALVQWLGIAKFVPWIFPNIDGSIYANLGQANHHAHFSWLGVASLFYLRGRGWLSRLLLWLLILLISLGSVLSGSRSVFIYPLVLLAALAWARHREPDGRAAALVADAAILLPILVLLNVLGVWASPRIPGFWMWLGSILSSPDVGGIAVKAGGTAMAGARLYESVSGYSPRLAITSGAWRSLVDQPWLGQGIGNFPWASFVAAADPAGDANVIVAEHAHNIVLQVLAEFGAPATIALILLLIFLGKKLLSQPWKLEHAWCGAVLGIGAVHSLLEYPLWYSYFLGPTALLLGATDSGRTLALAGRRGAIYLGLVAVAGAVILTNLRADYSKIEAASNFPLAAHSDRERAWQISMENLLTLQRKSLLSPWVLLAFTNLAEPSKLSAQDRADLCERGIHFAPARSLVVRCAMQLAIAGHQDKGRQLALAALHAFPAQRAMTVDELAAGARKFPEIEPLWQASLARR